MYLISYDISSDKLRNKVADELLNYGKRVQYSVFECDIDMKEFHKLYAKLVELVIEENNVSIRIYPLDADIVKKRMIIGDEEYKEDDEEVVTFI